MRIFKNKDGGVVYNFPAKKYVDGKPRYIGERIVKEAVVKTHDPIFQDIGGGQFKLVQAGFVEVIEPEVTEPVYKTYTIEDCKKPVGFEDEDHIVAKIDEVPHHHSKDGKYHEQIYCDGKLSIENIKIDENFSRQLMPAWMIRLKHLKNIKKQIAEELDKENPDAVQLARLQHQHDLDAEQKDFSQPEVELYWHEKGLKNLDRADKDVAVVKKKLQAKIKELKASVK